MVQQHAAMLAFVEAFWVMGVLFLLMLPFLPMLQYFKTVRKGTPAMQTPGIPEEAAEVWPEGSDHELVAQ